MKILICAIGKAKSGTPQYLLYQDYIKRLPYKVECKEFEVKITDSEKRKQREAELLLSACGGYEYIVALDENGKNLSSLEFARTIKNRQQQGYSFFAFIIGGADGLHESVTQKASLTWSLGRATWPHLLVRVLLAEQLYRMHSILSEHPYHRE